MGVDVIVLQEESRQHTYEEKAAALHWLERMLIIFRIDYCWRISTLKSYRDHHFIIFLILESISFCMLDFGLFDIYKVILGFEFRLASFNC